jgi:hypothetical protein
VIRLITKSRLNDVITRAEIKGWHVGYWEGRRDLQKEFNDQWAWENEQRGFDAALDKGNEHD